MINKCPKASYKYICRYSELTGPHVHGYNLILKQEQHVAANVNLIYIILPQLSLSLSHALSHNPNTLKHALSQEIVLI